MELDKALQFAVIVGWADLTKVAKPRSIRIEYRCEPAAPLDHLRVWADKAGGHQDLVCDYWTRTSSNHPSGARFSNGHHSDQLAQTLDFIMKNQDQFTRPADAGREGLMVAYPPAEEECAEAATWMKGLYGTATDLGGAADEKGATLRSR
jgi:hypothetical protein